MYSSNDTYSAADDMNPGLSSDQITGTNQFNSDISGGIDNVNDSRTRGLNNNQSDLSGGTQTLGSDSSASQTGLYNPEHLTNELYSNPEPARFGDTGSSNNAPGGFSGNSSKRDPATLARAPGVVSNDSFGSGNTGGLGGSSNSGNHRVVEGEAPLTGGSHHESRKQEKLDGQGQNINQDGTEQSRVKPSMGDKIAGTMDQMKGVVTHNPALKEDGKLRKQGELSENHDY